MKTFKKISTLILTLLLVFCLSGCGSQMLTVQGNFWFEDSSSIPQGFEEVLTYKVEVASKTPSNSTEVKVEGYYYENTNGTLTTKLQTKIGQKTRYIYTTNFSFSGSYVTPNETIPFVDTYTTVTEFYNDSYLPIYSEKVYNSELNGSSYKYRIDYTEDKASSTVTIYPGKENEETSTFEMSKYSNGAFIDNDLIMLFPRLYNINNQFVQDFKTIDVLSRKNHNMRYKSVVVEDKVQVMGLNNYSINGAEIPETEPTISCNHVRISITDDFSGSDIECYYATDHKTHRHRLVEAYTAIYGGLGYVKYSLQSAVVND